jgi:hypothetical protein
MHFTTNNKVLVDYPPAKLLAGNQNYADLTEAEKEAKRQRTKRRSKYSNIILIVGSIGSISFYFFSVMRKKK